MKNTKGTIPGISYHKLDNGLRLVHRFVDSPVAHFGLFIHTGSRDESEEESGLAHFIEHVFFKGTRRRKGFHILNRIESVGGELNAFTSKEFTVIYSTFLKKHYSRSVELIADIALNSVFPEKELEKEKEVIIDEINSYRDNPYELIFDEFEGHLFKGHPLSRNILGEPRSIKKFSRNDVLRFISRNYNAGNMVVASVGSIAPEVLFRMCEKEFGGASDKETEFNRQKFSGYTPVIITEHKNTHQTHSMIGNEAYARSDSRKNTLMLVNNMLGGPGLNSRLNLMVREKYGYSYHIESSYQPYSDTGLWCVYIGTTNGSSGKTTRLVLKELRKLRENRLGTVQLSRAKAQLTGQIAIHFESNQSRLLSIGKGMLLDNHISTLETLFQKIEKISGSDILEISNEIFDEKKLSYLTYISDDKDDH